MSHISLKWLYNIFLIIILSTTGGLLQKFNVMVADKILSLNSSSTLNHPSNLENLKNEKDVSNSTLLPSLNFNNKMISEDRQDNSNDIHDINFLIDLYDSPDAKADEIDSNQEITTPNMTGSNTTTSNTSGSNTTPTVPGTNMTISMTNTTQQASMSSTGATTELTSITTPTIETTKKSAIILEGIAYTDCKQLCENEQYESLFDYWFDYLFFYDDSDFSSCILKCKTQVTITNKESVVKKK